MEVTLSQDAQKQFDRLPRRSQAKVKKKILSLRDTPALGKKLVGDLAGIRSLRAWPYRILYEVNIAKNQIEVHKIAHRQGVYK